MWAGAAACRAGDGDDVAGTDEGALGGEDLREVAVADAEVAVLNDNVLPRCLVLSDLGYDTVEHCKCLLVAGLQVNAVVEFPLASDGVGAVAIGRVYFDITEWIGHAQVAVYPLLFLCV